jgi:flagella basal body P-ring formation protein FlgA
MKANPRNLFCSFHRAFIFSALVGVFFVANIFAQGKLAVRVSPETTIAKDQIALGDIAEITGGDETRARSISLGFAPRVGAMREIPRANILLALAAAGFSESDVVFSSPDKILVKRAAQALSQELLKDAVEKAVIAPLAAENVAAKITKLTLPDSLDLPTGNVEVRVVNFTGVTNFTAPVIVSLELRVDNKVLKRISANVEIEASADVFVMAHNGAAGAKLGTADVCTINIKLERSLASYIRTPEKLAGKKLLKDLPENSPLTADAVGADMVVKTGDTVSILARAGNMQISVAGEARSAGRIGDRIAVKNMQSGVVLQAQVVDEGTVKLNF